MKNDHFSKIEPCRCCCENDHFPAHFYFDFSTSFQAPLQHRSLNTNHHPCHNAGSNTSSSRARDVTCLAGTFSFCLVYSTNNYLHIQPPWPPPLTRHPHSPHHIHIPTFGPDDAHEGHNDGPQQPTKAKDSQRRETNIHSSQRQSTAANDGPQEPTKSKDGQRRPTAVKMKAHSSPRRPTQAHDDEKGPKRCHIWHCLGIRVFFSCFLAYTLTVSVFI